MVLFPKHSVSEEPEAYSEPNQTSLRKRFYKNSLRLQAVNYFCKKGSIVRLGSTNASVNISLHLTEG